MLHQPVGRDLRQAPRIKIFQPAEMAHGGGEGEPARVHLLNISTGGALVYGVPTPQVGESVRLACGVSLGEARVAWRSGKRFGVAFAEPIGEARVAEILRIQEALVREVSQRMAVVG
jgi:hypothetical protein